MWISVTSVFHQPILCVHIMSHQNSVFVAFIDQHTNPAKAKSIALTDRSSTQDSSVFKLLTSLYSYIALWLFLGTEKTLSLYFISNLKHLLYWIEKTPLLHASQSGEGRLFPVGTALDFRPHWACGGIQECHSHKARGVVFICTSKKFSEKLLFSMISSWG